MCSYIVWTTNILAGSFFFSLDPVRQLIAVPRADLISHLGTTLLEQERLTGKKGYSFTMQTCLHQFNSTPQESFRKEVEGKKKDYFSLPREAVKYGIQKNGENMYHTFLHNTAIYSKFIQESWFKRHASSKTRTSGFRKRGGKQSKLEPQIFYYGTNNQSSLHLPGI